MYLTFDFVITLKFIKNIFSITTPLSSYLQSKNIDFIQAYHLVDNAKRELKRLRSDSKFEELIESANNFSKDHNLSESHFKESLVIEKLFVCLENIQEMKFLPLRHIGKFK